MTTMESAQPTTLPILFSFSELIAGNGFVAAVSVKNGRALMETSGVDGKEEVWIMGAAPVGFAGGGSADRGFAFYDFRESWKNVLFDVAAEAEDFDTFQMEVQAFLSSAADTMTILWDEAVRAIRSKNYKDPILASQTEHGHVEMCVRLVANSAPQSLNLAAVQPEMAA